MNDQNQNGQDDLQKILEGVNTLQEKINKQEEKIKELEREKKKDFDDTASPPPAPAPPPPFRPETDQAEERPKIIDPLKAKITPQSFEERVGGHWLAKIGVVILILGTSFFLKYAFDNNWITETGRVILGIVAGIIMLGLGEMLRKKYLVYSQIISGGGIAILYLSIFAAYNFYHLISQPVAFGFTAIVTIAAGALSILAGLPTLAVLGIVGGFLAPILISFESNVFLLFAYIALLDLGILGISFFKNWRIVNILGLLGTILSYLLWINDYNEYTNRFILAGFLTLYFLIFNFATISHNIIKKIKCEGWDLTFLMANSGLYFAAIYNLFEANRTGLGFVAFGLAVFYFIVAYLSYYYNPEDKALALLLPVISVGYLTAALGLILRANWITMAWAVEAAGLIWMSFNLKKVVYRGLGLVLYMLVIFKLLRLLATFELTDDFIPIINERFLTFLVAIIALIFIGWFYRQNKEQIEKDEKVMITIIVITGNLLALTILSTDVYSYFQKEINQVEKQYYSQQTNYQPQYQRYSLQQRVKNFPDQAKIKSLRYWQSISLSILWAIYSTGLIIFGFWRKSRLLRVSGILLFGLTIIKFFLVDLWYLGTLYRIIVSISLGIILLLASFLYHKYREEIKEIL